MNRQTGNVLATSWQPKNANRQPATSPYKNPLLPEQPVIHRQQTGNSETGNPDVADRKPDGFTVGVRRRLPNRPQAPLLPSLKAKPRSIRTDYFLQLDYLVEA